MRRTHDMEKIYREYAQTVYRYLLSRCGDPDTAEELTQETFYQAVRSAGKFNGSCSVVTWLCAIAKNKLSEYFRKKNRELPINDDNECVVTSAEGEILASESRVELMRALRQLDPDVREVIYMRLFGELSFREIGEVVGRSENWARVTYYRGKERLKKNIAANM